MVQTSARGEGGADVADRCRCSAHPTTATHQKNTLSPSARRYIVQSAAGVYSNPSVQFLPVRTGPYTMMGDFIRNALLLPGIGGGGGGGVAGEFKETAFRAAVLQTLVVISYFAFLISNQSDL